MSGSSQMKTAARGTGPFKPGQVKVLLFDTFGTVVDWYRGIVAHGRRLGEERGIDADWEGLAKAWRAAFKPALEAIVEKRRPWLQFEALQRELLDKFAAQYGAQALSPADRDLLTRGWHYLPGWPDATAGLYQLKQRYIIGSLSNGSTRGLIELAKWADLPWDMIFGTDQFRTYKPDANFYRGAVALLGFAPQEVMMVAAHNYDLDAASKAGMRTCFVPRPTEDPESEPTWDLAANSIEDLAQQLESKSAS